MSLLDALVYGIRDILDDLTLKTRHSRLNFGANLSVTEDVANDCLTVTGVAGSSTWTIVNVTGGSPSAPAANSRCYVNYAGAVALPLPGSPTIGDQVFVKDASGAAFTNKITVSPTGGGFTIDGASTFVIGANNGAFLFEYLGSSRWGAS